MRPVVIKIFCETLCERNLIYLLLKEYFLKGLCCVWGVEYNEENFNLVLSIECFSEERAREIVHYLEYSFDMNDIQNHIDVDYRLFTMSKKEVELQDEALKIAQKDVLEHENDPLPSF